MRAVVLLGMLAVPTVVEAGDTVVHLEDLHAAVDRVISVPMPHTNAWGFEQTVQLPVHGTIESVRATGDVRVHVMPSKNTRVAVRTDPGLLYGAHASLDTGTLSLGSGSLAVTPRFLVETGAPSGIRADDHALIEVAAWTGATLELLAFGDAEIRVGAIKADELRIVGRQGARIVVTGPCEAKDLIVDTADRASFKGCGIATGA